jgi:hypothetical protein
MTNKKTWFGILVMVLIFGMTVVGCDNGSTNGGSESSDLDGTWVSNAPDGNTGEYMRIIASGGNFTASMAPSKTGTWKDVERGTYPRNGKSPVTVTISEVNIIMFGDADEWKTWANLGSTYQGYMGNSQTITMTISSNQISVMGLTFEKQ